VFERLIESFEQDKFPMSGGVTNILHYRDKIIHFSKYVTRDSEFAGFSELAKLLLQK
jgi:hypothetical protein